MDKYIESYWDEFDQFEKLGDMKFRKNVAAVIYYGNGEQFLLLHRKLRWSGYEFLKGGAEQYEGLMEAIKRELKEEIGIDDYIFIKDTGVEVKYKWREELVKSPLNKPKFDGAIQHFFLIKVPYKDAEIKSDEHDGLIWVRPGVVEDYLSFDTQKEAFRKVLKLIPELNTTR